jgi:hypothetical protein
MWGLDSDPNPDKTNEKWSELQRKRATNGNGPHLRGKIVNFDVTKSCQVLSKHNLPASVHWRGKSTGPRTRRRWILIFVSWTLSRYHRLDGNPDLGPV